MLEKANENEEKETILIGDIKEYSYIIIYKEKNKETYSLKISHKLEEVENIKKSSSNCQILSINEMNFDKKELNIETNQKIRKALEYAIEKHKNQYRHDGTEYIVHPIRVANYVKQYKSSSHLEELYIAALLHDVLEDTETTYYDIVNLFGLQVASIVSELTNDDDLLNEIGKTKYLEIKMKNMTSWALTIKLCDRLDNTCDLVCSNEKFRNKYLKDTLEIINYVIENRYLNKTQIEIIKEIVNKINSISKEYNYNEYYEEITKTKEKTKSLYKK